MEDIRELLEFDESRRQKSNDCKNQEIALRSGLITSRSETWQVRKSPSKQKEARRDIRCKTSAGNSLVGFVHHGLEVIEGFLHRQGIHLAAVVLT